MCPRVYMPVHGDQSYFLLWHIASAFDGDERFFRSHLCYTTHFTQNLIWSIWALRVWARVCKCEMIRSLTPFINAHHFEYAQLMKSIIIIIVIVFVAVVPLSGVKCSVKLAVGIHLSVMILTINWYKQVSVAWVTGYDLQYVIGVPSEPDKTIRFIYKMPWTYLCYVEHISEIQNGPCRWFKGAPYSMLNEKRYEFISKSNACLNRLNDCNFWFTFFGKQNYTHHIPFGCTHCCKKAEILPKDCR